MSTGSHRRRDPEPRKPAMARSTGRCRVTGKAMFITKDHAKANAKEYGHTDSRPFRCEECGYWHLGGLYGRDRAWHRHIHGRG